MIGKTRMKSSNAWNIPLFLAAVRGPQPTSEGAAMIRRLHVLNRGPQRSRRFRIVLPVSAFSAISCSILLAGVPDVDWKQMVEDGWRREAVHEARSMLTPEADAIGGCDGVKNGQWGFHTAEQDAPWWQVDLGAPRAVDRVAIWNRCDATAPRISNLVLLVSQDAQVWTPVFTNNGAVFLGFTDGKPLDARLAPVTARYVRIQLPGRVYLHLDEVEVYGPANPAAQLALNQPATQSSLSQWSVAHPTPTSLPAQLGDLDARWARRRAALQNPLLDFDDLLFTRRVPGSYIHMSDQYYGWWSRPGGGICILRNFKSDPSTGSGQAPKVECLTDGAFKQPGSFLRPMLSWDAKKVLFSWCRHYPELAREPNKMDKRNIPEDAFYHVFEMDISGANVRQLTRGKYDDIDARYLPDGRIVFLSTRRGTAVQAGRETARRTLAAPDLPDAYVRCGGGLARPVAVYTLHTMDADGGDLIAISPFEMFEWEPSVANDGSILYARWDYIDRHNGPFMSLWSTYPDGTNTRLVFGNYTRHPHCVFEPRSIPGSPKIVFTASGHHAQTMGSLVLLDPTVGTEGDPPMTRLTPGVPFPEIEGWPEEYYANPWPLSEQLHLVAWGRNDSLNGQPPAAALDAATVGFLAANGSPCAGGRQMPWMGLYLFDAQGGRELLYRDPEMACMYPIPLKPRPVPPVLPARADWDGPQEGRFIVTDVYRGLKQAKPGDIKSLRVVAVPPKTHPTMNQPGIGLTHDDPGKCVLGTVPVEADGSAHFVAPSGVNLLFQAIDAQGRALQTMRSVAYVQPGETRSCVGCHENRHTTPPPGPAPDAARREPSKIAPGPEGSWPFRYDQLVQPVLDRSCISCHGPGTNVVLAAAKSYDTLTRYGSPSVRDRAIADYNRGLSLEGTGLARDAALVRWLERTDKPCGGKLDADGWARITLWLDLYGHRLGSFSDEQEQELIGLRAKWSPMLDLPK
jgi:hypothetical protein